MTVCLSHADNGVDICTRPAGHPGAHEMSAEYTGDVAAQWPQAGLATFRPGLSRVRHCPKCRTGTLAYARRGDDPWAYCTNPACNYEFD